MIVTNILCHYTNVISIKQALAILPPTLPMLLLYTSTLVAPVARIAVTNIIRARAAMLAPRITNASCVGSTLGNNALYFYLTNHPY